MRALDDIIEDATSYLIKREAVLDALRFRSLRRLNSRQFLDLYQRNLKGENFDDMVIESVIKDNQH